jgi:RNA polymerase sigma factor (sigma-70 family)
LRALSGSSFSSDTTGAFPATRFSVVRATGSDDPRVRADAWDALVRAYWKPVYKYVRVRWNANEMDAQDATQEFFTRAIDSGFFEGYDPSVARFRTYLRVCLQRFLSNEHKAARRQKRGGDARFVSLDYAGAERELFSARGAAQLDEDAFFRQEAIRSLFELAVADVRTQCEAEDKRVHFRIFEAYDLHEESAGARPTYQTLADAFDVPVTQVTNYLHWVRTRFRRAVLDRLREVSGTEAEFRQEARELLGADPA